MRISDRNSGQDRACGQLRGAARVPMMQTTDQHHGDHRFDLRGRMAQAENVPGKLVGISVTGRVTSTMHYDHLNARVANEEQLGIYRNQLMYLVDHHNPTGYSQVIEQRRLAQISMLPNSLVARTDVPERSYVWGHGLISQDAALMITDHHGTVRQVMLPGGIYPPVETFTFDAFGVPTDVWQPNGLGDVVEKTHGDTYLHRYTGEPIDAGIGLQFNRQRWYDATSGVWTTMDSYEGDLNSPLTLHTRAYVHNNPVGFVDPSGQYAAIFDTLYAILAIGQLTSIGDVAAKDISDKNPWHFLDVEAVFNYWLPSFAEHNQSRYSILKNRRVPFEQLPVTNVDLTTDAFVVWNSGEYKVFEKSRLPSGKFVGTSGCDPCYAVIVDDGRPNGRITVAHYHSESETFVSLSNLTRDIRAGSQVLIAGGNSEPASNDILLSILQAIRQEVAIGITTVKYFDVGGLFIDANGNLAVTEIDRHSKRQP